MQKRLDLRFFRLAPLQVLFGEIDSGERALRQLGKKVARGAFVEVHGGTVIQGRPGRRRTRRAGPERWPALPRDSATDAARPPGTRCESATREPTARRPPGSTCQAERRTAGSCSNGP